MTSEERARAQRDAIKRIAKRVREARRSARKSLDSRKPRPGAYYTPSDVCGDVYDPVMGSGGFLAAMSNPEYSKDA